MEVETDAPEALEIEPLKLPVKMLLSFRFNVKDESLPTRMVPDRAWPDAFSVAMLEEPLQPSAHTERRTSPSVLIIVTPLRLMTALVFVTWNT